MAGPIEKLIREAVDAGYDVKITIRLREPAGDGRLTIPNEWARRLGMSDAEMDSFRELAKMENNKS